ncbi:MAG: glycosyltransferase family 2 protein [Alphaproteobacteria bacterium]|nr:glycosyltransferase family 2 protein [Alphaproteobacteria bacterium]
MLISIVVPTYNEAQNISSIYEDIAGALQGKSWELIVVDDDSPDGTAEAARALAGQHGNVRCIQRTQERGLCSAVHWGVQAAHGRFIVVMDGDRQHDPSLIPSMIDELEKGQDIVSGSRFLSGEPVEGLSSDFRQKLSIYGNKLINLFLGTRLTDPLTGFFATSRTLFLRSIPRMQAEGYKIFFDLIFHNRKAALKELPFRFRARTLGDSKIDIYVFWLLSADMISKLTGGLIPPRLVSFVSVGLIGSTIHFSALYAWMAFGTEFWAAQALATVMAMVFNFTLNNILTYSADRLRRGAFYKGLLLYGFIASFGIVANVSTAQFTYSHFKSHTFLAASVGIVIDVIWRFVVSNRLIWGRSSVLRKAK